MCDTFVATPEATGTGNVIFAKNSDREANEAQGLVRIPRRTWTTNRLRVTYIDVPQVRETYEVMLSKPFQIWGAEMGINEHGLTIGNEAIFTRVPFNKQKPGLTGMDMLRIALERCKTAQQALGMLTDLLAEFGQDACGGYQNRKFYYHNGFVIADPQEAYVLETAGREWAAIRVKGYRALSNGLTIEEEYDHSSPGLVEFARKTGWLKKGETFSFRKAYSDWFYTKFGMCRQRFEHSMAKGQETHGKLDALQAMRILRSHGPTDPGQAFDPAHCTMNALCIHATALFTPTQTTGSLVAELRKGGAPATAWFTGTSSPCLSVFKPVFAGGTVALQGREPEPGPTPDGTLWWRHEKLHRLALRNYRAVAEVVWPERDRFETHLASQEARLFAQPGSRPEASRLEQLSQGAFAEGDQLLRGWTRKALEAAGQGPFQNPVYRWHWRKLNGSAQVNLAAPELAAPGPALS